MKLLDLLLGRKLANREGESEKITAFQGVPAMGLDGLASSAYGPEAALTVLAPLGFFGLAYMGPITIAVLAVLAILYVSYWQTIEAYPTSGGSYTVARENLGANAGLLAATALMIDYVLNVAVGISAGVGALTSAMPVLHPHTLPLCLGILVLCRCKPCAARSRPGWFCRADLSVRPLLRRRGRGVRGDAGAARRRRSGAGRAASVGAGD